MTRRSRREIESAADELGAADAGPAEAYALLVAAASGDETAAERWAQLPEDTRDLAAPNL